MFSPKIENALITAKFVKIFCISSYNSPYLKMHVIYDAQLLRRVEEKDPYRLIFLPVDHINDATDVVIEIGEIPRKYNADRFLMATDSRTKERSRKPFLEELEEYNKTGRTCFCKEGRKFCDC